MTDEQQAAYDRAERLIDGLLAALLNSGGAAARSKLYDVENAIKDCEAIDREVAKEITEPGGKVA